MSTVVDAMLAKAEAPAPIIVSDPVFINTDFGAVTVYGHEHVSKKDLIILGHCLNMPEFSKEMGGGVSPHNVKSVIFRADNRPKNDQGIPILANCAFDSGAITINLLQTVTAGIEDAMQNPQVSIVASYHRNMIINFLHEIHHLSTLDDVPKDPQARAEVEEDAQVWAMDCLIYLAKSKDVEPAHHAESSFLANQLMELLAENTDVWAVAQRHLLDNHIMYLLAATDEKKEMAFYNFKGYVQILSGDVTSPDWNQETILGAGALNPFETAIRAIGDVIPAVHTPTSAMANTSEFITSEYLEMDDMREAIAYQDFMPAYGGFPVAEPAIPMNAAPSVVTTPAYSGFPVSQPRPTSQATSGYGMTNEQIAEIVMGVYTKCYNHIFMHCERLLNSDTGFNNPKAVYLTGVPLTPGEQAIVVRMDCLDTNERWCEGMSTSGGMLFGNLMKNTKLPHYELYINMGGQIISRLLLPQNPATKDKAGQYKQTALAARSGSCIMYVFESDDAILAAGGQKLKWKCINNVWEKC